MKLETMMKIMPDGTTKEDAQKQLDIINQEATDLVDKETKGLKTNQQKNLDQIKKLKGTQLPEDYDADGYTKYTKEKKEFDKKKKELEDQELEGKGQWEALKLKMVDTNKKTYDDMVGEKDNLINGLQSALDVELIENASIKAIELEEGNSFFLLPHMLKQIKTVQGEDGKYSTQVVDGEGNQRLKDDATTPFGVKDLVAEMKANEKFAAAFPEQNAGGGGNPNAGGKGGSGINPWKADTKNITAQAKMNKDNPTLAAQMRKAAGIAA